MIVSQKYVPLHADEIDGVVNQWRQQWPGMGVLVLLPEAEKESVPLLQAAFRHKNIPLLGALFPALVTDAGFVTDGAWLLCFERMPANFLVSTRDSGLALVEAAQKMLDTNRDGDVVPTLFMVFDGMIPNVSTLLNTLRKNLQSTVHYAGVNAGSETFQSMPCLFDGEKVIGAGVLGMLLPGDTSVVVRHGYPVSKALMRATSAEGNRIDKIDNRAAFEVYQEVIRAEYGISLTTENFYDYAVHFPFGLVTTLDVLVRIPVAFSEDGALFCVGEVPPNTLLRLLKAPDLELSACIREIVAQTGALHGRAMLNFYCAGRRMHFGQAAHRELVQLKELTGASEIFGALSLGEIDQIEELGFPRFHNAALVCLPQ